MNSLIQEEILYIVSIGNRLFVRPTLLQQVLHMHQRCANLDQKKFLNLKPTKIIRQLSLFRIKKIKSPTGLYFLSSKVFLSDCRYYVHLVYC